MANHLNQPLQMELDLRRERRGGVRPGAGRKASAAREGFQKHLPRPRHRERHPVHVVSRTAHGTGVPWLRSERAFAVVRANFARASGKGLRVLHFSVQGNHVHLIVEADDNVALARGIQRLLSRIAMSLNALVGRSGRVWRDRYFCEDLTSPTQVRKALVYVLYNIRKHTLWAHGGLSAYDGRIDPCSSAPWVERWASTSCPANVAQYGPSIVAAPHSWLARTGWWERGGGPLRLDEDPRAFGSRTRRPRAPHTP